jgi:NAD(P)-dependent dehydrogenase (short-subunit alcohol dehydrogenase family)
MSTEGPYPSSYLTYAYDPDLSPQIPAPHAGVLTSIEPDDFMRNMNDRVLSHIVLASAMVPLLRQEPGGSYTIVTGRLGEVCTNAAAAAFTVCNAAVYGVRLALQKECAEKPFRINEVCVHVRACVCVCVCVCAHESARTPLASAEQWLIA